MRFNAGTIYFVREVVDKKGTLSKNVKIGLVEDPRTAEDRLREHQTGNPRRLKLEDKRLVKTMAVKYVESQLHKSFATHRISGEWFHFESDDLISEAVSLAKKYSKQVAAKMPVLEEAARLSRLLSKGKARACTPAIKKLGKEVALASETVLLYNQLISQVDSVFRAAISEQGVDAFQGIVEKVDVYPKPKFSVTEFRAAFKKTDPELIERYVVAESRFSAKFELLVELEEADVPEELINEYLWNVEQIKVLEEAKDYFGLNELKLTLMTKRAPYEWMVASGEAQLKVECKQAPGILEVCSWVREMKVRNVFSEGKLFDEDPDLHAQFVIAKSSTTRDKYVGYQS